MIWLPMTRRLSIAILIGLMAVVSPAMAQNATAPQQPAPAAPARGNRPPAPTRDPATPGYVKATELPDGAVPAVTAYGNFILGPTHPPAPEMTVKDGVPRGMVHNFTMESTASKIYPGIARQPGSRSMVDPNDPAKRIVNSGPAAYTRRVAVYIPQQYVPGTIAPFIVGADGPDPALFMALDNLIAREARAGDDRRLHRQRQRRRAGQPARSRIRHDVGTLRGVRRDRSAAARREAVQREADEESECARDDGLQFGRVGRAGDGVVSHRSLPSRADLLGHVRESAVALQSGDSWWRLGISPEPDSEEPGEAAPHLDARQRP